MNGLDLLVLESLPFRLDMENASVHLMAVVSVSKPGGITHLLNMVTALRASSFDAKRTVPNPRDWPSGVVATLAVS